MSDNNTLETNKALVRRNFEVIWSQCNLDAADEIIAPEYVGHIAALITQGETAIERQLHVRAVAHAVVAQRATKAMRFNALQLRVRHTCDVD